MFVHQSLTFLFIYFIYCTFEVKEIAGFQGGMVCQDVLNLGLGVQYSIMLVMSWDHCIEQHGSGYLNYSKNVCLHPFFFFS